MLVYIAIYDHKHGTEVWPIFKGAGSPAPVADDVADQELDNFEPELDETLEIQGPWEVPE